MTTCLQVVMDDRDFDHLWHAAQEWKRYEDDNIGGGWKSHIEDGRFAVRGKLGDLPSLAWKWSYWFDEDYASVILASSYLTARGAEFEVVSDDPSGGWVILTDYEAS